MLHGDAITYEKGRDVSEHLLILDKNNFIFQLLSGCLATGLKFEICSVSISSKVETSLKIRYQEKFYSKNCLLCTASCGIEIDLTKLLKESRSRN